ncbi:MAG: carboxypeptidase-like regulatory domain-containing protein [Saprospiraceae bacterium]|nr:carboxypeptidase-like regulatory domain-containing protein [Saprospiraceae bacterium]
MRTLFLFIFLFPFLSSHSQHTIAGKVKDAKTNEVLAYASVVKQPSGSGLFTAEDGHFKLNATKSDTIVISFIGYQSLRLTATEANARYEFLLEPEEFSIEDVVVLPPDPDEIMRIADSLSEQNHFKVNTAQPGFYRERLWTEGQVFKVTEAVFDRHMYVEDNQNKRRLYVNNARSSIDSTLLKHINETFDFKRTSVEFDSEMFIEFGQMVSYNSGASNETRKKGKKTTLQTEYTYNGITNYLGQRAYYISYEAYKGKKAMANGRFLIHEDSYAFLAFEMQMDEEANLKKLVPFYIRTLLSLMGYNIDFKQLEFKVYQKPVDDQWFLDRSIILIDMGVAKGGNWVYGILQQEYYMSLPTSVSVLPNFEENDVKEVMTYDYTTAFWEDRFHRSTPESIRSIVEEIEASNAVFSGDITSKRYRQWEEKQERKKEKREQRKAKKAGSSN